jgi:steroid delta-isomerase-like uncharacterized protein
MCSILVANRRRPVEPEGDEAMSGLDAARRYFDAWNARDAAAVVASLGGDGSYEDPTTPGPLSGDALTTHLSGLWAAFPDLAFEVRSAAETGGDRVAAEWRMRGTNRGSFRGLPPTGREVVVDGADFIETDGTRVTRVVGYFDPGSVPRQLGLDIIVQPRSIGPFGFGVSTDVHGGRTDPPAVVTLTQLEAADEESAGRIREMSRHVLQEMLGDPTFIGATTARIGRRMVTISAWTDPDSPARHARQGTHGESMRAFFAGGLATSGVTATFSNARINSYHVRCPSCGRMEDAVRSEGRSACGAALPAHPSYW